LSLSKTEGVCDFADGLATTGAVDGEPAGSPSYNHARPDGSYNYGLQEPGLKAGYSEKTDRDGGNAGESRWDRDFTKVLPGASRNPQFHHASG